MFLELLFSGLSLGTVYALIALGFVVIYRASEVFNFAQGEFLTFGALSMVSLCQAGLPWFAAFLLSLTFTGILAATMERVALRPLIGKPPFITIILTIVLGSFLRILMLIFWDTDTYGMPTPWPSMATLNIFGVDILYNSIASVLAGAISLLIFYLLMQKSRFGVAMRATSLDQETSIAMGIPVGKVFALTWFIAGVFAATGGIFLSMFPFQADINLGFIAFRAFPAVIVGGLNSGVGAVIAGLLLGLSEVFSQAYINPVLGPFGHDFHAVFPYIIMILFLMIRPYGLFGSATVKRV